MTTQTTYRSEDERNEQNRRDTPVGFSFWDFAMADLLGSLLQAIFCG